MIELCLDQILSSRNFTLTFDRLPLPGEGTRQKSIVWQDQSGPLEISRVNYHGSAVYRLSHGEEIAVDLLPKRQLAIQSRSDVPKITVNHFLADQVLPRALAHYGEFILHSGALCFEDSAILLLGMSGRGKSTLAASYQIDGWLLLGDDAIVISWDERGPWAGAVYPSLRLFPDSIAALLPEDVTGEEIAHYSDKQRLSVPIATDIEPTSAPIKAMFVLGDPSVAEISVTRLSIANSCMAILENSFALDPTDVALARIRLDAASALARQVPAFALSYPRDYARLPDVRAAILSELRGI